jgi:hypothetical protein
MFFTAGIVFFIALGVGSYYFGLYLSLRDKAKQAGYKDVKFRLEREIFVESIPSLLESMAVLLLLFGVVLVQTQSDQAKVAEEILTIIVLQIRSGRAFEDPTFFSFLRRDSSVQSQETA